MWCRQAGRADNRIYGVCHASSCCQSNQWLPILIMNWDSANDLRYFLVLAASMKTGYVPLFTSPRNSLDGQVSLVKNTACTVFLTTSETKTAVEGIRNAVPVLKVYQVPTSDELFDSSQPVEHYLGRHRRDATAPTLILHTSGSTGKGNSFFQSSHVTRDKLPTWVQVFPSPSV